ncbi:MAG: polymerase, sigma subunit, family [Fibrobacteres bacterium]|nr:polymerase, sigma subunit, family [Fibrobacterota bacterium]
MGNAHARSALAKVDEVYRLESRRVLATLIRLLGDFDLAEEAVHEAFRAAVEQWPKEGVPGNPRAWLVSTGRFKAIDGIRRRARFDEHAGEMARFYEGLGEGQARNGEPMESQGIQAYGGPQDGGLEDDRLRLIFTCCHPALAPDSRIALTLREVCGLTTEEIARAFITEAPTVAQRIVRAKAKIREARIPYEVPAPDQRPDRLDAVLRVLYLVFNEGYSASSGDAVARADLSGEAIRLGRLLVELLPEPEAKGLLALMLLHESRRAARASDTGELILLEDQDRSLWNRDLIREGSALVEEALLSRRFGPYTLQAAISAVHAESAPPEGAPPKATDWAQIAGLYDVLLRADPSPIVGLNRAVAVAMRDGPEAGLRLIDALLADGSPSREALVDYRLAHSARADLLRRLGRKSEAASAYRRALDLTRQDPEKRFLEKRLNELESSS